MPSSRILRTLTLAATLLALVACAAAADTTPSPNASPAPQVVTTRLTALLSGRLNLHDNCLRVNGHLLVWPPEFTVNITGATVEVEDGLTGDSAIWQLGQTVKLGGGEVPYADLSEAVQQQTPANCHGPYWLVGGIASDGGMRKGESQSD